jgi:hypothetical protein
VLKPYAFTSACNPSLKITTTEFDLHSPTERHVLHEHQRRTGLEAAAALAQPS